MSHESQTLTGNIHGLGIPRYVLTEAEQRLRVLERKIAMLLGLIRDGEYHAEGFVEVAELLQVILLPASEFALARRHLQNSNEYCEAGELGASAFELRIVRGIVQRL